MADMSFLCEKAAVPHVIWCGLLKPQKTSFRLDNKQLYKQITK